MIGCLAGLWHLYVHFGLPEAGNLTGAAGTAFQQNKEENWERLTGRPRPAAGRVAL